MAKTKKVRSPWSFDAPAYDNRTGPSINAGTYWGTGYRNPMGTMREQSKAVVPQSSKRFNPDLSKEGMKETLG